MKHTNRVIIGTGVSGAIVLVAGIALGWYGFPEFIAHEIKHVSSYLEQFIQYDRIICLEMHLYIFIVTLSEITN
jgi:hypothetical protein